MLLENFFRIGSITETLETSPQGLAMKHYEVALRLNPSHPVFAGHFPGNPVVPGVCQVQMVSETLRFLTGCEIRLEESDNIKFLSMINPVDNGDLILDFTLREPGEGHYLVNAKLSGPGVTFLKFKGSYIRES